MNALTSTRTLAASLAPANMAEAMKFAEMLASSNMVPAAYKGKPADILVATIWGSEVGLGPLQALNGISVINGKPALWGDAALALVRGHPACAGIREGVEGDGEAMVGFCEVTRRGEAPQRRTFSVAEARKAGLWGKSGPWVQYPQRMLQMRARGFAIRDVFPDALRGVITAEEAQDMPTEPRPVQNTHPDSAPRPPATPLADAVAAAGATLPILAPSGTLHQVPAARWLAGVTRALAGLEDAPAVRAWSKEMNRIIGDIHATDPEMAEAGDRMIALRLAELSPPEPEAADPADAGEADDGFPGDKP